MNYPTIKHSWLINRTAILATMHQKEQIIAPLFAQEFGVKVIIPANFNSDRFGTFTRDIPRAGNQLAAARRKAEAVLELTGETLALASEGAFFPHPDLPFLACDRELVLLLDRVNNLEIVGEQLSTETNYNHRYVKNSAEALAFAQQIGFPEHSLVVMSEPDTNKQEEIFKGINQPETLIEIVDFLLQKDAQDMVYIETDLRAMCNPTRMQVIKQATLNLIQKIGQLCPQCACPGFDRSDQTQGLPCAWCHAPTNLVLAEIYQCQKCQFQETKMYPQGKKFADPGYCLYCNP
ncbi:hypothetical protein STA3757_45560 [Stanieria sp. NIES-3757]|nr:hypothetical protein STA3757_45560 [Stanieria sp. NIES-3757]